MIKAGTITSLAEKLGVPHQNLVEALKHYNRSCKNNRKAAFGNKQKNGVFKIEKPPFYAEPVRGMLNCTLGGIKINSDAQVVKENSQPIPGLFAAGEIMGGFYYDNYQIITGYLPVCLVFGRIAGRNAGKTSLSLNT